MQSEHRTVHQVGDDGRCCARCGLLVKPRGLRWNIGMLVEVTSVGSIWQVSQASEHKSPTCPDARGAG